MTSQLPVVKNDANGAVIYAALAPRTADGTFQTNPTLAAGDVKISIDDGAYANLTNLPVVTPTGSKTVKITLTQAETNGDTLVIMFSDQAGAEWCDQVLTVQTVANNFDSLALASGVNATEIGGTAQTGADIGAVFATSGVETGYALKDVLRLIFAVLCGKSSGLPNSPVYRDVNDTTNRVSGTLDSNKNRTAVTLDSA